MSFIYEPVKGVRYESGWFLVEDEPVTRETKTILQTDAITAADGSMYVPMGHICLSDNEEIIGIVYEDVDVTSGDMPGSVVTKGVVYEDRLADAMDSYSSATVPSGGNPKELGLYERSGNAPNYVYTLTTDTTAVAGKTYYNYDGKHISEGAKEALQELGFKFVATSPAVTRPY